MHVLHRGLHVGVAHPRLHLDDRRLIDRDRSERVAEVMEAQRTKPALLSAFL